MSHDPFYPATFLYKDTLSDNGSDSTWQKSQLFNASRT
jgi:hypothetical protein